MEAQLTNRTNREIELRYAELPELIRLYVTESRDNRMHFVSPRRGITWLAPPSSNARLIRLAPGARHSIRFRLLDYFDLRAGSQVTVWASVRVPGRDLPQLGGGGIGVRVR
jgi:hypothetical protein